MSQAKDAVPKPKRAMSAFFYFLAERRPPLMQQGLKMTEVPKKVGEEWREMNEEARKPYDKLNEEDKARYQRQLKEVESKGYFTKADGTECHEVTNAKKKGGKFSEETVLPKRPCSNYLFFTAKNITRVRAELGENAKYPDAMRKCGEIWKGMSENQKKPWNAEAAKDKDRYEKEVDHLSKHGYFLMEDGSKSSDYVVSVSVKKTS